MNELEIRAQAAYQAIASQLVRSIDEAANLRGEVAVKEAQLSALRTELEALKPKPEVPAETGA